MIDGKTIMSWNIPAIAKGNPKDFARIIYDAGFDGVALKGGEGNTVFKMRTFSPWPSWGENIKEELVHELRLLGIKVYLWHFLYGVDPIGELRVAENLCSKFNPDGYIWDVETAFESKVSAEASARLISKGLKNLFPNLSQGLCWWALPKNPDTLSEWHPVPVGKAFLETVDCLMPMMYWGGSEPINAIEYFNRSIKVWRTIGNFKMVPIGRAYTGDGGSIDPLAIRVFATHIMSLRGEGSFDGISWWSLDSAFKNSAAWEALKHTPRYNEFIIDPAKLSTDIIFDRLVRAHQYLYPELFKPKE